MCETMRELEREEAEARIKVNAATDSALRLLYGQHSLTARRLQTVHWEGCDECQRGGK